MLVRKFVFVLALAGATMPAAFANSGNTWMGAERGMEPHAMPSSSGKTRAEVKQELSAFASNPVLADGGKTTGNNGDHYVFKEHSYARQDGKIVHTDGIARDTPKPSIAMTMREQRQFHRSN